MVDRSSYSSQDVVREGVLWVFAKQRAAWEQRWTVLRTMTLEVFPGMSQPEEGAQPEQKHPLFEGAIALEMDATTLGAMPAPPNGGRGFLLKLDVDGVTLPFGVPEAESPAAWLAATQTQCKRAAIAATGEADLSVDGRFMRRIDGKEVVPAEFADDWDSDVEPPPPRPAASASAAMQALPQGHPISQPSGSQRFGNSLEPGSEESGSEFEAPPPRAVPGHVADLTPPVRQTPQATPAALDPADSLAYNDADDELPPGVPPPLRSPAVSQPLQPLPPESVDGDDGSVAPPAGPQAGSNPLAPKLPEAADSMASVLPPPGGPSAHQPASLPGTQPGLPHLEDAEVDDGEEVESVAPPPAPSAAASQQPRAPATEPVVPPLPLSQQMMLPGQPTPTASTEPLLSREVGGNRESLPSRPSRGGNRNAAPKAHHPPARGVPDSPRPGTATGRFPADADGEAGTLSPGSRMIQKRSPRAGNSPPLGPASETSSSRGIPAGDASAWDSAESASDRPSGSRLRSLGHSDESTGSNGSKPIDQLRGARMTALQKPPESDSQAKPKAKFKQWLGEEGVLKADAERLLRLRAGSTMIADRSPAKAYPHGTAAGQHGMYEGPDASVMRERQVAALEEERRVLAVAEMRGRERRRSNSGSRSGPTPKPLPVVSEESEPGLVTLVTPQSASDSLLPYGSGAGASGLGFVPAKTSSVFSHGDGASTVAESVPGVPTSITRQNPLGYAAAAPTPAPVASPSRRTAHITLSKEELERQRQIFIADSTDAVEAAAKATQHAEQAVLRLDKTTKERAAAFQAGDFSAATSFAQRRAVSTAAAAAAAGTATAAAVVGPGQAESSAPPSEPTASGLGSQSAHLAASPTTAAGRGLGSGPGTPDRGTDKGGVSTPARQPHLPASPGASNGLSPSQQHDSRARGLDAAATEAQAREAAAAAEADRVQRRAQEAAQAAIRATNEILSRPAMPPAAPAVDAHGGMAVAMHAGAGNDSASLTSFSASLLDLPAPPSPAATGTSLPLLSQEALQLTVPTDRAVKTAFRKVTTSTSGFLPLRRVVKLCKALGLPLERGWLSRGANSRDIDPRGEGAVTESEFMGWWGRHCARKRSEHEEAAVAAAARRHMQAERARAQESMRDGDETVRGPLQEGRWGDDEDGTTAGGRSLAGSATAGIQHTLRALSRLQEQAATLQHGLLHEASLPSADALPSRPTTVVTRWSLEYDAMSLVSGRQRPLRRQRASSPTPGGDATRPNRAEQASPLAGTSLPIVDAEEAAEAAEAAAAEVASLAGFSWVRKYRPAAAGASKHQLDSAGKHGVTSTWRHGTIITEDQALDAEAVADALEADAKHHSAASDARDAGGDLAGFLSSPQRPKPRQGHEPWPASAGTSGDAKGAPGSGARGYGAGGAGGATSPLVHAVAAAAAAGVVSTGGADSMAGQDTDRLPFPGASVSKPRRAMAILTIATATSDGKVSAAAAPDMSSTIQPREVRSAVAAAGLDPTQVAGRNADGTPTSPRAQQHSPASRSAADARQDDDSAVLLLPLPRPAGVVSASAGPPPAADAAATASALAGRGIFAEPASLLASAVSACGTGEVGDGIGLDHSFAVALQTCEAARFGMGPTDQIPPSLARAEASTSANATASASNSRASSPAPASPHRSTTGRANAVAAIKQRLAGLDLASSAHAVTSTPMPPDQWNEAWQQILEMPEWTFEQAARKAVATSALLGRFARAVAAMAQTVVREQGLSPRLRTIKPMTPSTDEDDGDGGGDDNDEDEESETRRREEAFYNDGIVLKVADTNDGGLGGDDDRSPAAFARAGCNASAVQRRVMGNELRGQLAVSLASTEVYRDWLQAKGPPNAKHSRKRPPPLCTSLCATVDVLGFRVYALAVPPIDEDETLVYGRIDDTQPMLDRSPILRRMLRRLARHLNLRPHATEALAYAPGGGEAPATLAARQIQVPLSVTAVVHQCYDKRFYLDNLATLMPAEAPAADGEVEGAEGLEVSPLRLRPELVRSNHEPLSADAFHPREAGASRDGGAVAPALDVVTLGQAADADECDEAATRAVRRLLVERVQEAARALDAVGTLPLDSAEITAMLHAAGVNMRYLGKAASHCRTPHARDALAIEMVARSVKHIVNRSLRRKVRALGGAAAAAGEAAAQRVAAEGAAGAEASLEGTRRAAVVLSSLDGECKQVLVDVFNLVLGSSDDSISFWREIILPGVYAKFGYRVAADETGSGSGMRSGSGGMGLSHGSSAHGAASASGSGLVLSASAAVALSAASLDVSRGCPLHRPALFAALQHHCGVIFADAPSTRVRDGSDAMQRASLAVSSHREERAAAQQAQNTAMLLVAPDMPGRAETEAAAASAGSVAAARARSEYAWGRIPEPLSPRDIVFMGAAVSSLRRPQPDVETTVVSASAEELLARGDAAGAVAAANLRIAILQAMGSAACTGGLGPSWGACGGGDSLEMGRALSVLSRALLVAGRPEEAAAVAATALRALPGSHAASARVLATLAAARVSEGDSARAAAAFAESVSRCERHLGVAHPAVASLHASVGATLAAAGRPGAALGALSSALARAQRCLGSSHPVVSRLSALAAEAELSAGRFDAAAISAERAVAIAEEEVEAYAAEVGVALPSLSPLARASVSKAVRSSSPPPSTSASFSLALVVAKSADPGTAAVPFHAPPTSGFSFAEGLPGLDDDDEEAAGFVRMAVAVPPHLREHLCGCLFLLAHAQARRGLLRPALSAATRCLAVRRATLPDAAAPLLRSLTQTAAILDRIGKPAEAAALLEPVIAALKQLKTEAALAAVQRATRHLLRLVFASMPSQLRAALQGVIRARQRSGVDSLGAALRFVLSRLWQGPPAQYIRDVVDAAVSPASIDSRLGASAELSSPATINGLPSPRSKSGRAAQSGGLGEGPHASDQLVCLVALLDEEAATPTPCLVRLAPHADASSLPGALPIALAEARAEAIPAPSTAAAMMLLATGPRSSSASATATAAAAAAVSAFAGGSADASSAISPTAMLLAAQGSASDARSLSDAANSAARLDVLLRLDLASPPATLAHAREAALIM